MKAPATACALAVIAMTPSIANSTSFYISVDVGHTMKIGGRGFEGYCINGDCRTNIGHSSIGTQIGLGWMATPRISFEVGYFSDSDIRERIPQEGRDIVLGEDEDTDFINSFKATPQGYELRARYFIPLSDRIDFSLGTGWRQAKVRYEGLNTESVKTTSLKHSAGIAYAANPSLVFRLEYHYQQNYFTTNGFDYSSAEAVTFGLEYHF